MWLSHALFLWSIAVNRSSPGATKGGSEATVTATRGGASAPIELCGRQHIGHLLNSR